MRVVIVAPAAVRPWPFAARSCVAAAPGSHWVFAGIGKPLGIDLGNSFFHGILLGPALIPVEFVANRMEPVVVVRLYTDEREGPAAFADPDLGASFELGAVLTIEAHERRLIPCVVRNLNPNG